MREKQPKTSQILIAWFIFLGAVVILPLTVSLFFLRQIVEENANLRQENLRNDLERVAQSLPMTLKPSKVLQTLFITLFEGNPKLRNQFFLPCAKRYPGAFQIAMWNKSGEPLLVPPSLALPAHLRLTSIISILNHGTKALEKYRELLDMGEERSDFHDFQAFLGTTLSLGEFFGRNKDVLEFSQKNIPTFLFWDCAWKSDIGFLGVVYPQKLPTEFFVKKAIEWNITKTTGSLAFLDLENEKNSFFSKDLPQTLRFARRLKRANEKKRNKTFRVDSFLAFEISADLGNRKKVFLLMDASPILQENERFLVKFQFLSGLILLLTTLILVFIQRGWGKNLSIVWRIAALLLIAIIIPLMGAFWAGASVIRELEKQDHQKLYQRLCLKASILPSRYRSFLPQFGAALRKRLVRVAKKSKNEAELIRRLKKMMEPRQRHYAKTGPISNFYVSDLQGNMKHHSTHKNMDALPFFKIILRHAFRENIDSSDNSSGLVGETVIEELGDAGGKKESKSNLSLPINTISTPKYSSGEMTLLPMTIELGKQPRILLVQMDRGLLEQYFFRYELLQDQSTQIRHTDDDGIQKYFYRFREEYQNFSEVSESPILSVPELEVRFYFHWPQDIFGQFSWNEEQYLFYMAPRALFRENRFFALASTSPIQKNSIRRQNLLHGWFLFVLLIAFLMGVLLSRRIIQPLQQLDSALGKIREGDLTVHVPQIGEDEIGWVGQNVNLMVGELREKERMQAYLSDTTLQAIRDGSADQNLEAQHKEVTIFFSDIRGFTTLSEQHSPEDLFSGLNDFFETVDSHIRNSGGQVQKFIGDAAYAVFPEEGRKGAQGAVSAALAIMKFLTEFNQQRKGKGLFTIAIGIGINTGNVLLGKVGSDARKDFAYIGDEVNVAASLESASKQGKYTRIMISQATYDLLKPLVIAEETEIPPDLQPHLTKPIYEVRELSTLSISPKLG